jgi:hypothetical protein
MCKFMQSDDYDYFTFFIVIGHDNRRLVRHFRGLRITNIVNPHQLVLNKEILTIHNQLELVIIPLFSF